MADQNQSIVRFRELVEKWGQMYDIASEIVASEEAKDVVIEDGTTRPTFEKALRDRFNELVKKTGYEYLGDYVAGVEITEYNQILRDQSGEFWKLSGTVATPYTTTGAGLPEGGNFVAVGDATLRDEFYHLLDNFIAFKESLKSEAGAGMIGYKDKYVADYLSDNLNLLWYAREDGRWDLSLQAAINEVVSIATKTGKTANLPSIKIPAGDYAMGGTVTTHPWVKIRSTGSVIFDFSKSDVTTNGFVINNEYNFSYPYFSMHGHTSPCFNGDQGTITIRGHGRDTSQANGLVIGNSKTGFSPCRDVGLTSVVVTGWQTTHRFTLYDVYLFSASNCLFEFSGTGVAIPSGTLVNSGERMSYNNCTFAGMNNIFAHAGQRYDFNFLNCSFDFFGNLVRFFDSASYAEYKFSACYFEGWDGLLVANPSGGDMLRVSFYNMTALPTRWKDQNIVGSASRKLISTTPSVSVVIDGIKMMYTARPYLEDSYIVGNDTKIDGFSNYHHNPFPCIPLESTIVNRDYSFNLDAVNTNADSLTAWIRNQGFVNVPERSIANISNRKALQLVGTDAESSGISFTSKNSFPVLPGDQFYCNASVLANNVTGDINVSVGVEFFNGDGNSLGVFPTFRRYKFSEALADASLPNFSSGGNRTMDTVAYKAIAPSGAVSGKAVFSVTKFNGTLYITKARVSKI